MGERDRWALWIPVFLGLGIGFYFSLPLEPPLWLGWAGAGAGAFILIAGLGRKQSQLYGAFWLALSVFSVGFGVASLRTWNMAAPVIQHELGPLEVQGQVLRIEQRPKGSRVTLTRLNIENLASDQTPDQVRMTLLGAQPSFVSGDRIKVWGKLNPPPPPAQPGAFDFQRQSYFRGLGGVGFSYGRVTVIGQAQPTGFKTIVYAVERWRQSLSLRVRTALPGDVGAVAAALMMGDRGAILDPYWKTCAPVV